MNKLELAAQLQGNIKETTMALVTVQRSSVAGSPHCSISDIDIETDNDDGSKVETNCSDGYFAGQETDLVVDLKDIPQPAERRLSTDSTRSTNSTQSNSSDIQQHLQSMFYLLRHGETLKMAVKLESQRPNRTRYLVITSRICFHTLTTDRKNKTGRSNSTKTASLSTPVNIVRQEPIDTNKSHIQSDAGLESTEKHISSVSFASDAIRVSPKYEIDRNSASGDRKCSEGIEESCLLGIDCNERATIGLVVPILADTTIHLDGDGGFSVAVYGKTHIFKPVSVQAMWSALQTLHKVSQKARENNFYPGGPSHEWLSYYESRIESDQSCLNEWNAMDSIESRRPPSPDAIRNKPTEKEETECVIKMKLKEIMMSVDLDEVTSKYIRVRLEELLDMDLGEYKSFIDQEMLTILGQMDAPTEIFEHVYLGSEWNASNLEELQKNGVRHILNVTREIDNFFPGMFNYFNVRVYDDEKTNLLKHWDNTFRYINRAKNEGSKVLVHCKMGVSRSASVVIAYAMKAYNWEFQQAMQHVKERRNCIKPNKNFLNQLETYRGMLDAMKNKEKLQRSKSETNLKSTKDARLLPGSEPTPLIQALNQSKSKALGVGGDGVEVSDGIVSVRSISSASDHKQRRVMRRSSSTSPKSIQNHIAIVIKQQSQSLENLTPERNVADEPKNVRFPGNNGENYSVTQNQVLHIQKNTATSVKTIVNDLESFQERKTVDDRKSLNLLISRSNSVEASNLKTVTDHELQTRTNANNAKLVSSPVWTSSTKLITQLSTLSSQYGSEICTVPQMRSSIRLRRDTNSGGSSDVFSSQVDNVFEKEEVRHTRKTQSWAPRTCSNITVPAAAQTLPHTAAISSRQSSNSSIDSMGTARHYEVLGCPRTRQREFLSRHSSWGSGDQRSILIARNSSWGAYDTNRNTFQYGSSATTAAAIIEGQIHELNMSNKTDFTAGRVDTKIENCAEPNTQHTSTVKRTKLKLEESTILKKLCQENGTDATQPGAGTAGQKRTSNLYRSQSAAAATRSRFPNRCNSEEIMSHSSELSQRPYARRSDGSKPFHTELFSASAPDSYTISDIENKNTLQDHSDTVELRHSSVMDDQRMSGNVQILKKNFELKAGGGGNKTAASTTKKGHQSLPSSPVAQHVDHLSNADVTASTYFSVQTNAAKAPCYATGSNLSSEAITDCNVKGLVHRYQATSASIKVHSAAYAPSTSSAGIGTFSSSAMKSRPRSYYENRHSTSAETKQNLGKPPHGYNDCRPPPAPLKSTYTISSASSATRSHSMKDGISTHNQQRRLQQHGKTHPLARLSLPKQSFNAAAYNTM